MIIGKVLVGWWGCGLEDDKVEMKRPTITVPENVNHVHETTPLAPNSFCLSQKSRALSVLQCHPPKRSIQI